MFHHVLQHRAVVRLWRQCPELLQLRSPTRLAMRQAQTITRRDKPPPLPDKTGQRGVELP